MGTSKSIHTRKDTIHNVHTSATETVSRETFSAESNSAAYQRQLCTKSVCQTTDAIHGVLLSISNLPKPRTHKTIQKIEDLRHPESKNTRKNKTLTKRPKLSAILVNDEHATEPTLWSEKERAQERASSVPILVFLSGVSGGT